MVVWVALGERVYSPPVLTAALALAIPVALAVLVDRLRDTVPGRWLYKPEFLVIVAVVVVALGLVVPWAVEAAIGAAVVLALTAILVTLAHLLFLGALALLLAPKSWTGELSLPEAGEALQWRDGRPAPANSRVKRIANIVHPGSKRPHGPLHKLVAEICDTDVPPFAKSFLRLDLAGNDLTVRLFKITGDPDGQASTDEVVACIALRPRSA